MLNNIRIEGFKSIENESLKLAPLTILTGTNSSGKSTVIQALLLVARFAVPANRFSLADTTRAYSNVRDVRNKFTNSKETNISLPISNDTRIRQLSLKVVEQADGTGFTGKITGTEEMNKRIISGDVDRDEPPMTLIYENVEHIELAELFYLNANRIGPQDMAPIGDTKVGIMTEFLFGYFDKIK